MTASNPKVGISTWADFYDPTEFIPGLEDAEYLKVDMVEIPAFTMDLIVNGQINKSQLQRLKEITRKRPFGYTVHGPTAIDFMDDQWRLDLHETVLKASIEIAAELGAVHHVLHCGKVGDEPMPAIDARFARQRERLARAGDFAREHGVVLTVENVWTYNRSRYTALPFRLAQELALIDHDHVRACLDVSHAYINATLHGADFLDEIAALAPFAPHLHIHDSFGRPKDISTFAVAEDLAFGLGDLHLPVGWGSIPWRDVMARARLPRGTIFNIELNKRYWGEVGPCVAATRELANQIRYADETDNDTGASSV